MLFRKCYFVHLLFLVSKILFTLANESNSTIITINRVDQMKWFDFIHPSMKLEFFTCHSTFGNFAVANFKTEVENVLHANETKFRDKEKFLYPAVQIENALQLKLLPFGVKRSFPKLEIFVVKNSGHWSKSISMTWNNSALIFCM